MPLWVLGGEVLKTKTTARPGAATKEEPRAESAEKTKILKQKFREDTKANEDLLRTAENAEAAEGGYISGWSKRL